MSLTDDDFRLEAQLDRARAERDELTFRLRVCNLTRESAEEERDSLRSEVEKLKDQLKESNEAEKITVVPARVREIEAERDSLRAERDELSKRYEGEGADAWDVAENEKARADKAEAALIALKQELEAETAACDAAVDKNWEVKAEAVKAKYERDSLRAEVEKLGAQLATAHDAAIELAANKAEATARTVKEMGPPPSGNWPTTVASLIEAGEAIARDIRALKSNPDGTVREGTK